MKIQAVTIENVASSSKIQVSGLYNMHYMQNGAEILNKHENISSEVELKTLVWRKVRDQYSYWNANK